MYDKKLLWRANLYIDEGAHDWNNLNPWNAPPAANSPVPAEIASWWDPAWGYNEWNRVFGPETAFLNNAEVGLNNLAVGNGGQVVSLSSGFTPVRNLTSNQIRNTVAYSYPRHRYQPAGGWTTPKLLERGRGDGNQPPFQASTSGDPGSMDSPFDFVWKLRRQRDHLNQTGTATLAPSNSWWSYSVTQPEGAIGDQFTDARRRQIKYVPSLGLYLAAPQSTHNETMPSTDTESAWPINSPNVTVPNNTNILQEANATGQTPSILHRRNASWILEAGADCVGFAQRDASYSGNPYTNWVDLPPGMMEYNTGLGTINPYAAMAGYNNTNFRQYPVLDTHGVDIVSREVRLLAADGTHQDSLRPQPTLEELRRVVPGDIWVKDSTSDTNTERKDHIAIVASVPEYVEGMSSQTYMEGMVLIEGEFTYKIQSVVKYITVADYNANVLSQERNGGVLYPGEMIPLNLDLRTQSWAIRRVQ